MKRLADIKKRIAFGLGVGALAMGTPMANAVDLCTGTTTFSPDGGVTNIPMWGFGTPNGTACDVTVPGPPISATEGEIVTINLTNNLSVPVSLIVTGHNVDDGLPNAGPDPQFNADGRVRSLVNEAAASGGTAQYIVTAKAGSFIYHSATHQQVQVQMGLYGAMSAAPASPLYNNEITMFYSEIDPDLHAAVANGCYAGIGTPGVVCGDTIPNMTSTFDYKPRYFLVNGAPSDGSAPIDAGDTDQNFLTGQDILVRMFNAGLRSRTMQTLGTYMNIVAENGAATKYAKTRHTADVHALGTTDVIIKTGTAGDYRLYDRRLAHSDGTTAGGIISTLHIVAGTPVGLPPVANSDSSSTSEDTSVTIDVATNDAADTSVNAANMIDPTSVVIVSQPDNGIANDDNLGNVTYVPFANFNGTDSFTYTINDSDGATSNLATVTVTVENVNDAPVALSDSYVVVEGTTLNIAAPGVLTNDSDVDTGDTLTANQDTGTVMLNSDGSFVFNATGLLAGASDSFTYHAVDSATIPASSNIVMVTIDVVAAAGNIAPVAVDETVTYSRAEGAFVDPATGANVGTTIAILANDSDADGTLDPASVVLSETAKADKNLSNGDQGSSVSSDPDTGEVTYIPPVAGNGTDVFTYTVADNLGAVSNTATVRVNIVNQ